MKGNSIAMRCLTCNGSKIILGLGMVQQDCVCQDEDNFDIDEPSKNVIDKRSKAYRDAISRIMSDSGISKEKAMTIFDDEFSRL